MPLHDWGRVEAGIFQDFHHSWIEELKRALNRGVLPRDYYALAEQHAVGLVPDVLTLQQRHNGLPAESPRPDAGGGVVLAPPRLKPVGETDMTSYRRRLSTIAVRHVSDDRVVAMLEVVSPGNKGSDHALRSFVEKVAELLHKRIHLLILDLHPPGPRDPRGLHAVLWDALAGQDYPTPGGALRTLAAYEAGLTVRAYVVHPTVGERLPEMPLFLERELAVDMPLEETYSSAFDAVPRRWRAILEAPA